MIDQLAFFGAATGTSLRPGRRVPERVFSPVTPSNATVAAGAALMTDIISNAIARRLNAGDVLSYAQRYFGLTGSKRKAEIATPSSSGCDDSWFCNTYHHAPSPNTHSFAVWHDSGKAFADLLTCPWYRATLSWGASVSRLRAEQLSEVTGHPFAVDPSNGCVVAPPSYNPAVALEIGTLRRGVRIIQSEVIRGAREPAWFRAGRSGHFESLSFIHGILTAYVAYDRAPTETASPLPYIG